MLREQTRGLSSNALKLIALLTMFLDHIGAVLIDSGWMNQVLRMVGRVSFPIFAFLLVEGTTNTAARFHKDASSSYLRHPSRASSPKNKVKKTF